MEIRINGPYVNVVAKVQPFLSGLRTTPVQFKGPLFKTLKIVDFLIQLKTNFQKIKKIHGHFSKTKKLLFLLQPKTNFQKSQKNKINQIKLISNFKNYFFCFSKTPSKK
jgi:hypothetical protein